MKPVPRFAKNRWVVITVAVVCAALCAVFLYDQSRPVSADATEVAGTYKKMRTAMKEERLGDFYGMVEESYLRSFDYAQYESRLAFARLNMEIDARHDVSFRNGKAYVRCWREYPGTSYPRRRVSIEFEKQDGRWLYTGKYDEATSQGWGIKSLWRRVTGLWKKLP